MGPVCTIMVGRTTNDWLKVQAEKNNVAIDPGLSGVGGALAVFKKTYKCSASVVPTAVVVRRVFATICTGANSSAATCHFASALLAGRFNASDIEVRSRIDEPVQARLETSWREKFLTSVRASH